MSSARSACGAETKWLLGFLGMTYLTLIEPFSRSDEARTKVAVRTRLLNFVHEEQLHRQYSDAV